MIGPQIPKSIRQEREKVSQSKDQAKNPDKKEIESDSESSSDDDVVGPQLPEPSGQTEVKDNKEANKSQDNVLQQISVESKSTKCAEKPKESLLLIHQKKLKRSVGSKDKIHKFDHARGVNDEVKKEILKNVNAKGALNTRFTRAT